MEFDRVHTYILVCFVSAYAYLLYDVDNLALAASWHSGHRVRLQTTRSRVQIPPGCKDFRSLYNATLLAKLNLVCRCEKL
jgi:hypothetical protein